MLCLPSNLEPDEFLRQHWQKRPLFMPQALFPLRPSITRNELAWLATLDDVESRIVFRDVDDIMPAANFRVAIDDALSEVHCVLVTIGPDWLDARSSDGTRRLDALFPPGGDAVLGPEELRREHGRRGAIVR